MPTCLWGGFYSQLWKEGTESCSRSWSFCFFGRVQLQASVSFVLHTALPFYFLIRKGYWKVSHIRFLETGPLSPFLGHKSKIQETQKCEHSQCGILKVAPFILHGYLTTAEWNPPFRMLMRLVMSLRLKTLEKFWDFFDPTQFWPSPFCS